MAGSALGLPELVAVQPVAWGVVDLQWGCLSWLLSRLLRGGCWLHLHWGCLLQEPSWSLSNGVWCGSAVGLPELVPVQAVAGGVDLVAGPEVLLADVVHEALCWA